MPIDVDVSQAPALLRYRYSGAWPWLAEQSRVRESLIAAGHLTADTVAIMDVRELTEVADDNMLAKTVAAGLQRGGWPRRRAYIVNPMRHLHMVEEFRDLAQTTVRIAAFIHEDEALLWLRAGA